MDKTPNNIKIMQLRPTQITVGMLQVRYKQNRLRTLVKKPGELVAFILEHPIRVVLGPKEKVYVIDHHHLALALMNEAFDTAPMDVEEDLSRLSPKDFWRIMEEKDYIHPYDENGSRQSVDCIPKKVTHLIDDPYRSLAGFVREGGGYEKVDTPFAEFLWADYFRQHLKKKLLIKNFKSALECALELAHHEAASDLPGYLHKTPVK